MSDDSDFESYSELSTGPLPLSPIMPINSQTNDFSNSERVQESRSRFEVRVTDNIRQSGGDKNTFMTWLKAHLDAHSKNGYIINDSDYTSLKKFLIKKSKRVHANQLPILPLHLHNFIDKHSLRIECVKVSRSTASTSQIDNGSEYSTSKEIVGDAKNSSSSNSLQTSVGSLTLVPFGRIERILHRLHGDLHIKSKQLYALVQSYFIGITREMTRKFVSSCKQCGNLKSITEKEKRKVKKLQPIISQSLFERWEIDLFNFDRVDIVDGVPNYAKCYVVQCVDHKSKLRFAEHIPSKDAIHVVTFLNRTFGIIGAPKILQSDNGSEFVNQQMEELLQRWGVEHVRSRPYHPATNGAVENANKSLKRAIKNWIASNPDKDWTKWLPIIVHTLNSNIHLMLNASPYQFVFNCNPWHQFNSIQSIIGEAQGIGDSSDEEENSLHDVVIINNVNSRSIQNDPADCIQPIDDNPPQESYSSSSICISHPANATEVGKRRRKIDAFHRNQIKKMKLTYDKGIQPREYEEGDVVRLSLSEQDRRLLPQSLKVNNIPVRIVQKIQNRHGSILYRVRTANHLLSHFINTEVILPSPCDTKAFTHEYSWSIDDWDDLEVISLPAFLKQMKIDSVSAISLNIPSPEAVVSSSQPPDRSATTTASSTGKESNMFEIGSCVGLDLPNDMFGKVEGEIIPCIVLERDFSDGFIYSLGIKDATIKHWYRGEYLKPLGYAEYQNYFGISHILNIPEMVSNWGYSAKFKKYTYISVDGAIYMYRNPSQNIPPRFISRIKIPPPIQIVFSDPIPNIPIISALSPNPGNEINTIDASTLCNSCNTPLNEGNWHRCKQCKTRIHGKIICPRGKEMVQEDDVLYCVTCSKLLK
jgi:IS30 family transposase